jgi:hypothetical protein
MFIPIGGGSAILDPSGMYHTIAMTNPAGTVVVEQQGEGDDDWFPYVYEGNTAGLDAQTTARGVFAHLRLKVTATGTGVRLYNSKMLNQKHNIIQS